MLSSSLNTGSTDLRDTEVQQPNTTATLSLLISSRAFSANSGQFEAGSTTTASSFLPSTPPFLFCSSMSISITSFNVVSLIAIVPDSECRMPILIVSWALAGDASASPKATPAAAASQRRESGRKELRISHVLCLTLASDLHRSLLSRSQGACQGSASPSAQ